MLGERGPQHGLFDADHWYGDFVGSGSFYGFLASQRNVLFRDEDFAKLYCRDNGRPSVPPSLLATALVLQTFQRVSDAEAKQRADYDLRWKVALGIAIDERPFAKSTLQEFRAQLVLHEEQRAIFRKSLELAKGHGYFRGKAKLRVALDTTNILGRGAVKDTYNLLADGIVQVLRVLAQQAGESLATWAQAADLVRYVNGKSLKGQATVTWEDAKERQGFLQGVVEDADRVLGLVRQARVQHEAGDAEDAALAAAAGLLSRLLVQDIERGADGAVLRDGVAPDRVVSVHDPEMRHGRKSKAKRFDGHKAQVAVDTESQLITAVDVLPGNAPDHDQALEMVQQTEEATDSPVEETMGDGAYGDGATRQVFVDAGRKLIAKVPGMSNQGRFPKTAFVIDLEAQTCTCPAGETTADLRRDATKGTTTETEGGDQDQNQEQKRGGTFQFAAVVCVACPLLEQCVRGTGGRTVRLHPQEALLQAARELQASPEFAEYRQLRQAAEHRLARLVQLGLRQARYFGRAKTLFQLCMAATVANLTLLANRAAQSPTEPDFMPIFVLIRAITLLTGTEMALVGRPSSWGSNFAQNRLSLAWTEKRAA